MEAFWTFWILTSSTYAVVRLPLSCSFQSKSRSTVFQSFRAQDNDAVLQSLILHPVWSRRMEMNGTKWQSKPYSNKGGTVEMGDIADFKLNTGPNVLKVWLALCENCSMCTSR